MSKNIGMVSLGCDKNRVDGENVLFSLKKAGYNIVQDASLADVIIINTCAFIDSAKKESIDTILEFAKVKLEKASCTKLVVMGCLAERYGDELKESLPEVDVFVGINSYHDIINIIENQCGVIKCNQYIPYEKGRIITTPMHYAYLKIADGCDNFCTYCAIPYIRGRYHSYPMEELLKEAEGLSAQGIKELILVAQDTTRYGIDLYNRYALKDLIRELVKLNFTKIRLLYAYPELIDEELIRLISTEDKLCKYLDIPLQHIDDNMLRRMNRRSREAEIKALITKIKQIEPNMALRSSFIVGFPNESEAEFNKLKSFIAEGLIDYAGFFTYSKEEGTAAAKMSGQMPSKVKKQREKELSKIQSQIVVANHKKYIGKILQVIYEGIDYNKQMFFGRSEYNAPEIDTKVYFTSQFPLEIGNYYAVKITEAKFDLYGQTIAPK